MNKQICGPWLRPHLGDRLGEEIQHVDLVHLDQPKIEPWWRSGAPPTQTWMKATWTRNIPFPSHAYTWIHGSSALSCHRNWNIKGLAHFDHHQQWWLLHLPESGGGSVGIRGAYLFTCLQTLRNTSVRWPTGHLATVARAVTGDKTKRLP